MCGISGWISNPPLPRRQARALCRALLYYSRDRGKQSAGIYLSTGKLYKAAVSADDLIMRPAFNALFTTAVSHALMHTRQPTSGGLGDAQAQPFQHGDTTSIHNGMLIDSTTVAKQWGLTKHSGVDSELVAAFVDAYGIERLPEFLENVRGPSAIAVVYKQQLFLLRDNNPTSHLTLELPSGGQLLAFASTRDTLMHALRFCWLVPDSCTPTYTPSDVLLQATPTGLLELGRMKTKAYTYPNYCSGVVSSRPDLFDRDGCQPNKLENNPNWKRNKHGVWKWVGDSYTKTNHIDATRDDFTGCD